MTCRGGGGLVRHANRRGGEFLRVVEGGEVTHRVPRRGEQVEGAAVGAAAPSTCSAKTTEAGFDEGDPVGFIETLRVEAPGTGLP